MTCTASGCRARSRAPAPKAWPATAAARPAIYRGDLYVDWLVKKIQASPIWTNTAKRVAIVLMFDEASRDDRLQFVLRLEPERGPARSPGQSLGVLTRAPDGTVSVDRSIANYNRGNRGHGTSVFGVLTNQPKAPKHVVDSDAYSHLSFVRTLQDMFQLADPGDDWSYMNRSKYTERFIAAHLSLLPEYANSADPHFDAVRPMNHAYVIPAGYVQKNGFPDAAGRPRSESAQRMGAQVVDGFARRRCLAAAHRRRGARGRLAARQRTAVAPPSPACGTLSPAAERRAADVLRSVAVGVGQDRLRHLS